MTTRIQFDPVPGTMTGWLTEVPAFPGERFWMNVPESIGDAHQISLGHTVAVQWSQGGPNQWVCLGHRSGELDYVLTLATGFDTVDLHILLTNRSSRVWAHGTAFTCLNSYHAPSVADFDCVRHWARTGFRMHRLTELPRKYSARPTLQVYAVLGAPPVSQIPFAEGFEATPPVLLENWLAIVSCDGSRLAAVASHPALFLFQNSEFSCIHSCPDFGPLAPGQTGEASTRVYLAQAALDDWHLRMKADFGL